MFARILVLAFAAMLLLPGVHAEDERRILYLHNDGTLNAVPTSAPVNGGSFAAAPAAAAYVLRSGAVLEIPTAMVGQEGVYAQLRVNGTAIGVVSTPLRLLNPGASTTSVVFDNAETTVAKGGVLSVYLQDSAPRGLVGGLLSGLVGTGGAPRLVIRADVLPAPPVVAPTPPPPTTVTPPTATQPVTNTTTIVYWPVAPSPTVPVTPTNGAAADTADDSTSDQGAANRAALATTFSAAIPNLPPASMLMLMLLATAAIGLVSLFRLGRP